MKRFPVTLFNIHSRSVGSVSPSEQLDRPRFRANFSRWGPGGVDLNLPPIRAVLKLRTTRSIRVSSGFDYLRTDQMFSPMPLLRERRILYELVPRSGRASRQSYAQACQPNRHERYRVMTTEEEEGCRKASWALEEGG